MEAIREKLDSKNYKELQQIAKKEGVKANGKKIELVERIAAKRRLDLEKKMYARLEELDSKNYKELQQIAKKEGVKANGKHGELLERIRLELEKKIAELVYVEPVASATPDEPVPAAPPSNLSAYNNKFKENISKSLRGAEIVIKPGPLSHWGFVTVGDEVQAVVYVRNETEDIIEIFPRIEDDTASFKLVCNNTVHLQPHTTHEFGIIFCPTGRSIFSTHVTFIDGAGNRYSHRLLGYGGVADIKVIPSPFISYNPRDGVYRFLLELENVGQRTAFVHIVPEGVKNVSVSPESFCLFGKEMKSSGSKIKITVRFPEGYVEGAARMSLGSATSASTFPTNTVFALKVYYGVERLRQRAERYSDDIGRHQTFKGLNLTKTPFLLNGTRVDANDGFRLTQQDVEMLKAQTRVLTIIVGRSRNIDPDILPEMENIYNLKSISLASKKKWRQL